MDDIEIKLTMTPANGEEQTLHIESCLIGGTLDDSSNAPFGAYLGSLSFDRAMATFQTLSRAYIKVCEEQAEVMKERGMFDATADRQAMLKAIRRNMVKLIDNAIEVERENAANQNVSVEEHMTKFRYDKGTRP